MYGVIFQSKRRQKFSSGISNDATGKYQLEVIMKRNLMVILILFLICGLFSACQPTPETEAVVNKNEGVLESRINQEVPGVQSFDVPETINEEIRTTAKYSVVINAGVKILTLDAYPVYSIAPADFTQSEVDAVIKYFFKESSLFTKNTKTKSMIKDQIVQIKADLQNMEPGDTDDIEGAQAAIERLEEEYESAPETATNTQVTSELTVPSGADFEVLIAYANLGYTELSSISVANRPIFQALHIRIDENRIFLASASLAGKNAEGQNMTPDEAKQQAEEALAGIGIEGMTAICVETGMTEDQTKQGYAVTFRRNINGVPVAYNTIISNVERVDMAAEWSGDRIIVRLDDQGISSLDWSNKGEIQEDLTANVQMLIFNDIMEIARQQLKNKFAYMDTSETDDFTTICIDSIVLEYTCVQKKDNPNAYLLVPAWNFYINTEEALNSNYLCALSLNAIDGSVIG